MAFKYRDYVAHAITFYVEGEEGRNTWEDWRIVPTSRPTVAAPNPKYNFVQIPGSSFIADLTEVIAGEPTYEPREGTFEFAVINKQQWQFVYETILNYLQGKRCRFVLADDPGYYYEGRCHVETYEPGANYSNVTIHYNVQPFKYRKTYSLDGWTYDATEEKDGIL